MKEFTIDDFASISYEGEQIVNHWCEKYNLHREMVCRITSGTEEVWVPGTTPALMEVTDVVTVYYGNLHKIIPADRTTTHSYYGMNDNYDDEIKAAEIHFDDFPWDVTEKHPFVEGVESESIYSR